MPVHGLLFLNFFTDSEFYKLAYQRPPSYYAVYTIVLSIFFITFVNIMYQIRKHKKKPRKIKFD